MTRARSTAVTLLIVVFQLLCASSLLAQSNSALAEFIEEGSVIKDRLWRQVEIKLNLSQQVPYRVYVCLLYTSPSPRDLSTSRMPSSA